MCSSSIDYTKQDRISLNFLWLDSVDLAISRVATRVKAGGHSIPEDDIRRRYDLGLRNFFALYQPLVDEWVFYNGPVDQEQIIASYEDGQLTIVDSNLWKGLPSKYGQKAK